MSFSSLNFEIKESHKLFISPFDRGFIFGDAIYEMILCIDGRCIFLEDHLARLKQSLASIKLIPDFKEKNLEDEINRIAKVNNAPFQAIYVQISRGVQLIRNHLPEYLFKVFSKVGYTQDMVKKKFSGMINALSYGAPPHGGMAPGIDRIVMLLANQKNIREVTLFPLTQNAQDLLMGAPSDVDEEQLKQLNIKINKKD